jgi:hypothetical protein
VEHLENRRIARELKERLLIDVGNAHRDPVSIADLLDADRVGQVADGALLDVLGHQQAGGSLGDEVHRIEGCLQRPWDSVDVTHFMPADNLRVRGDTESAADFSGRYLDLNLGRRPARLTAALVYLRQVPRTLVTAASTCRISGEHRDERVDPPANEGALAWSRLHEALAGQPFDRVPDGVSRGSVAVAQLKLGRQLCAWREGSGLDLSPQVLGDLLIQRLLSHGPSPQVPIIPMNLDESSSE